MLSNLRFASCLVFHFWGFQSAQNLAQISDLQAQLEDALKEKQEIQEKVDDDFCSWHKNGEVAWSARLYSV